MGADVHWNVWISPDVVVDPVFPEYVHLMDGTFIGWSTKIFSHMVLPPKDKGIITRFVKDDVFINGWVGGDCTIEPGCIVEGVLGAHSYLRAGKHIRKGEYWYGIPAKNHTEIRNND